MIWHTHFLGIPLHTQRQRRLFVVGYIAVTLAYSAIPLLKHKPMPIFFVLIGFTLASMLGGLSGSGPVRPFGRQPMMVSPKSEFAWLNEPTGGWNGAQLPDPRTRWTPPDERERNERDHAHYVAFRILRWTTFLLTAAFFLAMRWWQPALLSWLMQNILTVAWVIMLYVLSLPQCVVLWTEHDTPGDLEQPTLVAE